LKRAPVYALSISAAVLMFSLIVWSLFQHGTTGFLRVTNLALYIFILVGLLALLLLFLTWLLQRMNSPSSQKRARAFSLYLAGLSALFLLAFAALWLILAGFPSAGTGQHLSQKPIAQADPRAFHFAVGSDAHFGAGTNNLAATRQMLAQISDPKNSYGLFLSIGDLVEYGFLDSQWKEALQAFSPVAATVPLRFAPGNHDYLAPTAPSFPGDTKLWYRLDAGNIHFLVLDVEWSAESYTAAQAIWLEDQLRSLPPNDWKVVLSHGFYYASGISYRGWKWFDNPETIAKLTPLFEKYKVDLVFSGHDHDLELLEHGGVRYVVCGGFGGLPDPDRTYTSPASLWYRTGGYGFTDVAIQGDEANLIFRAPDGGSISQFNFRRGS
jgi:UDP-2,3-diacylglucosamine pyrophosphatase LpxH